MTGSIEPFSSHLRHSWAVIDTCSAHFRVSLVQLRHHCMPRRSWLATPDLRNTQQYTRLRMTRGSRLIVVVSLRHFGVVSRYELGKPTPFHEARRLRMPGSIPEPFFVK
jgi:hypothetical protein